MDLGTDDVNRYSLLVLLDEVKLETSVPNAPLEEETGLGNPFRGEFLLLI